MSPPIRLVTLGTLQVVGSDWRPAKALTLLTYLSLQGPVSRRRLRELFWPHAQDAGASLRVVLDQFRRRLPGVVQGDDTLEANIVSDAARLLGLGERQGDAADAEAYAGPFLSGVELNGVSGELEEWVLDTRERLAGAARLAMVRAAELAGSPAEAAHWTERAAAITEAQPPESELLERMLRLTLPGSLLEAELRRDLSEVSSVFRTDLPQLEQGLLGREREVNELLLALSDPAVRLLEITGPGGMGKSMLATALLREQADLSGIRVLSVALESALASSEAAARMVVALGLQVTDRGNGWLALARAWGDRPLLALLDGVEGLPDLGRGIVTLLTHCPNVRLVITSRVQRLTGGAGAAELGSLSGQVNLNGTGKLAGAVHLALDGLSVPAPGEPPARVARCAAVRLFVRGARRYLPRFAADDQNAPLVSAIVRRLDGHPLATVLSATWMRVYPPAQIHTLILQDLFALRAEDSWHERHQLSAVFERSWQLLTPEEAQAVSALAVFQGFTPDAALSVAGVTPALLDSLVAHSLLRTLPQGRLEIPPVLAAQAQAHLPDAAVQDAHAEYYLEYLMSHAPESDEVDTERVNIVAATAHSLSRNRDTSAQIDILLASYDRRGLLDSGTDAFHMLRETLTDPNSASAGSVLVGLAWLAYLACRYRDAEATALMILENEQAFGLIKAMKALNITAISMVGRGEAEASLPYLNRAIAIAQEQSQEVHKILYSLNLSETYADLGRYAEAFGVLEHIAGHAAAEADEYLSMCIQSQYMAVSFYSYTLPDEQLETLVVELIEKYKQFKSSHVYLVITVLYIKNLFRQDKLTQAVRQLKLLQIETGNIASNNITLAVKILDVENNYLLDYRDRARGQALEILDICRDTEAEDGLYDLILVCAHDIHIFSPQLALSVLSFIVESKGSSFFQKSVAHGIVKNLGEIAQKVELDKDNVLQQMRDVLQPKRFTS